jgi:pimeloyl-ACP methyl ester carboxylesterase
MMRRRYGIESAVQAVLYLLLASAALAGAGRALLYRPDLPAAALERDYADGASRFIETGSVRFHYRDEGEGEPIVLLHGLTANLFVWDAWAQRLSEHFRVIRLDLPGHGLTGPNREKRCGWPQVADLVVRLLDQLDVARATFVGNSFGRAIAWQIAARHPERVSRLVLIAPVGYTAAGQLPWLIRLLAHPVSGPLLARLTPRSAFMQRVQGTYADPARLDPEQAERQYRLLKRAGNRTALRALLRAAGVLETESLLQGVRTPTLLMWGAGDPVLHPSNAQQFARDIAEAKVVVIPSAGHTPMLEQPEPSVAALLDFLGEDKPGRDPHIGTAGCEDLDRCGRVRRISQ